MWVLVIAFAGSLVFWGAPGKLRSRGEMALEVFGHQYTRDELNMIQYRRERVLGLDRIPEEQLTNFVMFLEEAKRLGIKVSDQQVKAQAMAMVGGGESISPKQYEQAVSVKMGLPGRQAVGEFEAAVRDELMVRTMFDALVSEMPVSEAEAYYTYLRQNEEIKLRYAFFSAEKFGKDSEVTDDEVARWYEKNREEYFEAEEAAVEYVYVNLTELQDEVQIPDEEISNYYEHNKELYKVETPKPATGSAEAEAEPKYEPFDKVKEKIRLTLASRRGKDEADSRIKAASSDIDLWLAAKDTNPENPPAPLDFAKLAGSHKLKYGKTELFGENNPPEELKGLTGAASYALSHDEGDIGPIFRSATERAILRVASVKPRRQLSLKEATGKIREEIKVVKGREVAQRDAAEFAKEAKAAGFETELKSLSLEEREKVVTDETDFFPRPSGFGLTMGYVPKLGIKPAVAKAAASLAPEEVSDAVEESDGFYVASLAATKPADPTKFEPKRQQFLMLVKQLKQFELLMGWQEEIKKRANVTDLAKKAESS